MATVEEIFLAAVDKAPADRDAYLDAVCGANADFEQSRLDYDLALLQGRWEAEKPAEYEPASTYGRITKQIEGNRETVTFYGPKGDVLQAHAVDFTLEQSGRVTLFTFRNYEVAAGPSKGQKWPASRSFSYLYTVNADTFVDIMGVLDGASGPPRLTIWKRASED